jgi:hypothetical protein
MLFVVAAASSGCAERTEPIGPEQTRTNAVGPGIGDSGPESDGLATLSCTELFNEFHMARIDLAAQADRECADSADCQVVEYGASCFAGCGHTAAVAASGVEPSRTAVQALEERYCAASEAQACVHIPLPCDPVLPPTAECVDGICSLVFGD